MTTISAARSDSPRARRLVGLLLLSLLPQACLRTPGLLPPRFMLAPQPASVLIYVGSPERSLQFLRVSDWETAEGALFRVGEESAVASITAAAIVAGDGRGRRALLGFPLIPPGDGYTLRVMLKRRDAAGRLQVVGSLEQQGLTLVSGSNTLNLTSIPEARETPTVTPVVGQGPYVSSIPGVGLTASLANAQDVIAAGNGEYYFLDNGRLGLIYKDSRGREHVRTVAGVDKRQGAGLVDGPGASARFSDPKHMVLASPGVLFVADGGGNTIRKVTIDAKGEAVVTTLAGTGLAGIADGPGSSASFNNPSDVAIDVQGNLIVADTDNHRVRKVTLEPDGTAVVSTLAGDGTAGFLNGSANAARFRFPGAIACSPNGTIYVGDSRNYRLRAITSDVDGQLTVSTAAGSGSQAGFQEAPIEDDGPGATARFGLIAAVRVTPSGSVYVNDFSLRQVTFDGSGQATVATVGVDGNVVSDFSRDLLNEFSANGMGFGPNGEILLAKGKLTRVEPRTGGGVAIRRWIDQAVGSDFPMNGPRESERPRFSFNDFDPDEDGNLFFAANTAVYRLSASNLDVEPTLIAGHPTLSGSQDGAGLSARFVRLDAICVISHGETIYLADRANRTIRRLVRDDEGNYTVSTYAGIPGVFGFRNGLAESALFNQPHVLANDLYGNLYVTDDQNYLIRKISVDPVSSSVFVTTAAGSEPPTQVGSSTGTRPGYRDGPALAALMKPAGLTVHPDGSVLFSDDYSRLRKIEFSPGGNATVKTLAGTEKSPITSPVYIDGIGTSAKFTYLQGIAVSQSGDIYVADYQRLRKIKTDSLGRSVVSTVAGVQAVGAGDGPPDLARFGAGNSLLSDMKMAGTGDLFIHEEGDRIERIRRVSSIP